MRKHNPKNYVVELHLGVDVMSHDYGSEIAPAQRAIERLKARKTDAEEIRLWHDNKCISSF